MSGRHTPGPWVVINYPHCPNHPWVEAKCNFKTAEDGRSYYMNISGPITQDDARLIAAAPDLYEALRGLLEDIQDYQRINNLGGENNHSQVVARAAIAKVEGRS